MQQLDMFEETLTKKICRLEKWMCRLQKEMLFLKEVHALNQLKKTKTVQIFEQDDLFGT